MKEADKPRVWLVLAHCFNMDGRAASQTITDKLPYLAKQGVVPVVISAATGTPDPVWQHHQVISPAPSGLRFESRHMIDRVIRLPWLRSLLKAHIACALFPFYLLEKAVLRLDSQWSWFLPAYRRGMTLVRRQRPELIYAAGGAGSAFLAAYLISRQTGIPWIAEIYDPMVLETNQRGWQFRRWNLWLEGLICTHARAAFWFTNAALAKAKARHPQLQDRGHVILPGVLPPDFGTVVHRPGPALHFAHFGSLAVTRNLVVFFQALALALVQRPQMRTLVRVDIFGGTMDNLSREAMNAHALGELVVEHGRLEHDPTTGKSGRQRVLEAMRVADVLILLHGTDSFCEQYIPSKTYEYFWTARPILAATHLNPQLDDLLWKRGHHPVVATDVVGMQRALVTLMDDWRESGLPDLAHPLPLSVAQAVQAIVDVADRNIPS